MEEEEERVSMMLRVFARERDRTHEGDYYCRLRATQRALISPRGGPLPMDRARLKACFFLIRGTPVIPEQIAYCQPVLLLAITTIGELPRCVLYLERTAEMIYRLAGTQILGGSQSPLIVPVILHF